MAASMKIGFERGGLFASYLHGIFDAQQVLEKLVQALADKKGVTLDAKAFDMRRYKEEQYDKLADVVRSALDMEEIYSILEGER